jgi:dTMP kinase
MSRTGCLLVLSGLDGAGKSTQIALLATRLAADGHRPKVIWSRGGYTPLFNALKDTVRRFGRGRIVPKSGHSYQRSQTLSNPLVRRLWLTFAIVDLWWLYGIQVRWLCWRGRTVICDRYLWDTLIDFHLNFPQEQVELWGLWRLLVKASPRPDAAFLLLVPVEESLRRSRQKQEPFPDSPEMLSRRLTEYQTLARNGDWRVMDGCRPVNDLAAEIWAAVVAGTHGGERGRWWGKDDG